MKRNSIGIDIVPEYYQAVKESVDEVQLSLFERESEYETSKPD